MPGRKRRGKPADSIPPQVLDRLAVHHHAHVVVGLDRDG